MVCARPAPPREGRPGFVAQIVAGSVQLEFCHVFHLAGLGQYRALGSGSGRAASVTLTESDGLFVMARQKCHQWKQIL